MNNNESVIPNSTDTTSVIEWINGLLFQLVEMGVATKPIPLYSNHIQCDYGGSMSVYFLSNDVSQDEFNEAIEELGLFWHAKDLYKRFENRVHVAVIDNGKDFVRMVFGNDREII